MNRMPHITRQANSDGKKRRSLLALLLASGDMQRSAKNRMSLRKVQCVTLEEDDKDFVVSFALSDTQGDIESLILLRTLFYEEFLDEDERGVKVSLENDEFEEEDRNMLVDIRIANKEIAIRSTFREYKLDISSVENKEIQEMVRLLEKQNYDNRFTMRICLVP